MVRSSGWRYLAGGLACLSFVAPPWRASSSYDARAGNAIPQIWFAPLHPNDRPGGKGAADYFSLFQPTSPWQTVSSHISVFQIYLDLLRRASDEDLRRLLGDLSARHVALAIEMPALVETAWCEPGRKKAQWMVPLVGRLKRLGGELQYVAMVGPLVDGHVYTKAFYCHRTISEVAVDAARTASAIRELYPNVLVGDIEPVADPKDDPSSVEFGQWFDAFKRETGQPLAFLHLDVRWRRTWQRDVLDIARQAHLSGIKFGLIFHPDHADQSSDRAAHSIAEQATSVASLRDLSLDHVVFQTWVDFPDHVLPESDPTSMAGVIKEYLRLNVSH
jgi:hypothetical protein